MQINEIDEIINVISTPTNNPSESPNPVRNKIKNINPNGVIIQANETNPGTRYKTETTIPIINNRTAIAIIVVIVAVLICKTEPSKSGLITETLTLEVIPFLKI